MMMAAARDKRPTDYTRAPLVNWNDPAVKLVLWIIASIPMLMLFHTGYIKETLGDPNAFLWFLAASVYPAVLWIILIIVGWIKEEFFS